MKWVKEGHWYEMSKAHISVTGRELIFVRITLTRKPIFSDIHQLPKSLDMGNRKSQMKKMFPREISFNQEKNCLTVVLLLNLKMLERKAKTSG